MCLSFIYKQCFGEAAFNKLNKHEFLFCARMWLAHFYQLNYSHM
jgi:hypothetical protein